MKQEFRNPTNIGYSVPELVLKVQGQPDYVSTETRGSRTEQNLRLPPKQGSPAKGQPHIRFTSDDIWVPIEDKPAFRNGDSLVDPRARHDFTDPKNDVEDQSMISGTAFRGAGVPFVKEMKHTLESRACNNLPICTCTGSIPSGNEIICPLGTASNNRIDLK